MDISVAKVEPRQALASGAMLNRGRGYCADEWTGIAVVAVYISPNSGQAAFGDFLDEDGECVERCFPRQVLVLGNFNAHSTQSGNSATYTRGRWLTDWAAGLEHVLANKGTASTCVAWGGVICGRRHVGHLGSVREDPRLESGLGSRNPVRSPLHIY
jgi:hypothetical protein